MLNIVQNKQSFRSANGDSKQFQRMRMFPIPKKQNLISNKKQK